MSALLLLLTKDFLDLRPGIDIERGRKIDLSDIATKFEARIKTKFPIKDREAPKSHRILYLSHIRGKAFRIEHLRGNNQWEEEKVLDELIKLAETYRLSIVITIPKPYRDDPEYMRIGVAGSKSFRKLLREKGFVVNRSDFQFDTGPNAYIREPKKRK